MSVPTGQPVGHRVGTNVQHRRNLQAPSAVEKRRHERTNSTSGYNRRVSLMKRMWAALLLCGALSLTIISARAHDLDFPNQLRAINVCHTQWSAQHPGKALTDAPLVACMKAQGFRFDPSRQIKGVGPCHGNKTATNHPDCYAEPPKTRARGTRPTVGAARVPGYPLRVGGALTDETIAVRAPVTWRHAINIRCRFPTTAT